MDWRCDCLQCKALDKADNYTITHLQGNIFRILPFYDSNPNPDGSSFHNNHNIHETRENSCGTTERRSDTLSSVRGDVASPREHTCNSTQGVRGQGSTRPRSQASSIPSNHHTNPLGSEDYFRPPSSHSNFLTNSRSPAQVNGRDFDVRLKEMETKLQDILWAVRELRKQVEPAVRSTPIPHNNAQSSARSTSVGTPAEKVIVKKSGPRTLVYELVLVKE